MKIVTLKRLNSALADVIRDFESLGIWNERLYRVELFLVPVGFALGWKWDGPAGHISIPAISTGRLGAVMFGIGETWGLRDVLRHEYAHAVADTYPGLTRSRNFRKVFEGSYDDPQPVRKYDPEHHVTTYAAKRPCEDFSEVFMYYVKHRGRIPARFDTPAILRKWRFISRLVTAIARSR